MLDLAGKRVTVMGLGRFGGGVGVTRFLVKQGADVLVTDTAPTEKLAESVAQLSELPGVTYRLGEHNVSDFTTCDLVVANPAVKPDNHYLRAAEAAGIPITSEIRLLVERLPSRRRIIGVTGSAGKSTVTAMIGHVLGKAATKQSCKTADENPTVSRVWMGGNIGGSLLDRLDEISEDDWVVLELSSFMLDGLRANNWSPHIAVVTNISSNHLDWHLTFEHYRQAKFGIVEHMSTEEDIAIFGPGVQTQFASPVRQMVSREADDLDGQWPGGTLLIPGDHNRINALLAADAVEAAIKMPTWQSIQLLFDFPGLPHRLQFVCEHNGVRFFNDSKCTTPEAARLAIEAFEPGNAHIILGGYDKGSDLKPLAALAAERCAGAYTIGDTGDAIAEAMGLKSHSLVRCGKLDVAVREAVKRAKPGQVVLLSPACASWDQFTNFEQRGAQFVEFVLRYTTETGI